MFKIYKLPEIFMKNMSSFRDGTLLTLELALYTVLLGTLLSGVLFTLSGMIIAMSITSLNQFFLAAAPVEMLAFGPAVLHLAGVTPAAAGIYPANVCMDLIAGRAFSVPGLMLAIVLMLVLLCEAERRVRAMWRGQGGAGR